MSCRTGLVPTWCYLRRYRAHTWFMSYRAGLSSRWHLMLFETTSRLQDAVSTTAIFDLAGFDRLWTDFAQAAIKLVQTWIDYRRFMPGNARFNTQTTTVTIKKGRQVCHSIEAYLEPKRLRWFLPFRRAWWVGRSRTNEPTNEPRTFNPYLKSFSILWFFCPTYFHNY